jgi:hypothetical protein
MPIPGSGAGGIVYLYFTTRSGTPPVPTTLSGTPAISIYKNNSATPSTSGVTLSVDVNGVTGFNRVAIDTSTNTTFYLNGNTYAAIISAGTVGGTSVVGEVQGQFVLQGDITTPIRQGVAQAGNPASMKLDSGASSTNNLYKGALLYITGGTGVGQAPRVITNYNGSSKQAIVDWNWVTAPDNTSQFSILPLDVPSLNSNLQVTANVAQVTIRSGTAQSGSTSTTIKLDSGASSTNNIYNGELVTITGGTGLGQEATIVQYNGSTKVATVGQTWITTPDATSTFNINASTTPSLYTLTGVAAAGGTNTITFANDASSVNNIYNGSFVTILAGTGSGETGEITGYVGSTQVATVSSNWATPPDSTSVYAVLPTASGTGTSSTGIQTVNLGFWGGQPVQTNSAGNPIVNLATALTIQKNTALSNFMFVMVDSSGNPLPGLTVTATRSLDNAAFAACANAVVENPTTNGAYGINLAATDTNGNNIMFKFTAPGAVIRWIYIATQTE